MCARVTKSRVDEPGCTTSGIASRAFRHNSTKLEWVSTHPLGRPCRSGGVDEGGEVGTLRESPPPLHLLVGHIGAGCGELVQITEVDLPDVPDHRHVGVHLVETREVVCRLGDDARCAGVGEVPEHLSRRRCLVDRHEHGAREPHGEVDQCPLVTCLAHEADLVARLDPGGDEALGQRAYLLEELRGSDIRPAAVGSGHREQRKVRSFRNPVDQKVRRVRVGVGFHESGHVVLFHGNSFDTGMDWCLHSNRLPQKYGLIAPPVGGAE